MRTAPGHGVTGLRASWRHAAFGLVLVAFLVAGCTTPTPAPDEPAVALPLLDEFAGCPWAYADGSAVDCDALPVALAAAAEVPTGWICVDENPTEGWSFHWDPVTGGRGVRYALAAEAPADGIDGVFRLVTGDVTYLYNWTHGPTTGFLALPATYGDTAAFRFTLYRFGYAWNGTALEGASAEVLWSLHDDQFWAVHRLATPGSSYTFQAMKTQNNTRVGGDGEETALRFHEPISQLVSGADFTFAVVYTPLQHGRSLGSVDTLGVDRDCALG